MIDVSLTEKQQQNFFEFIWDLEVCYEHSCADCFVDISAGREYHKKGCKLLQVIKDFKVPECPY